MESATFSRIDCQACQFPQAKTYDGTLPIPFHSAVKCVSARRAEKFQVWFAPVVAKSMAGLRRASPTG